MALTHGLRIPCADGDAWISDDPRERARAAPLCRFCPVRSQCAEAGESTRERFGVWAGRDLTPFTRKPGRPRGKKPEEKETSR
ncbi:WhiB family transcriptional regulator [Intrasporangium calvum]|uniref:WhiB family transcriptional regulator n=1 Tax=Intrasporangium calvum TaxID=53358 RepID=UPI0002ED4736|nr:WhiB family transcriptional regulator [Intrasporangium calvum]